MVEIDDNFFENCRNRGQGFYPIKEWPKDNYRIILSFQITVSGREQLFLNRIKNERRERGAEIPLNLAQEVGQWLFKQTSSDAYQKGECASDDIGRLGDYKFTGILIIIATGPRKTEIRNSSIANCKISHEIKIDFLFSCKHHNSCSEPIPLCVARKTPPTALPQQSPFRLF